MNLVAEHVTTGQVEHGCRKGEDMDLMENGARIATDHEQLILANVHSARRETGPREWCGQCSVGQCEYNLVEREPLETRQAEKVKLIVITCSLESVGLGEASEYHQKVIEQKHGVESSGRGNIGVDCLFQLGPNSTWHVVQEKMRIEASGPLHQATTDEHGLQLLMVNSGMASELTPLRLPIDRNDHVALYGLMAIIGHGEFKNVRIESIVLRLATDHQQTRTIHGQ